MDTAIYHPKKFNPAILWWVAHAHLILCLLLHPPYTTNILGFFWPVPPVGTAPRRRNRKFSQDWPVSTVSDVSNVWKCLNLCLLEFRNSNFGLYWKIREVKLSKVQGYSLQASELMAIVIARVSQPMVGCLVGTSEVGFWIPNAPRIGDVVGDDRGEDGPSQPWLGNLWDKIQNGWCPKMTGTKNVDNMW